MNKKKHIRRRELLEASAQLINEYGYENLKVRDVCKRAGASVSTFYHCFEDKADLIVSLSDEINVHYAQIEDRLLKEKDEAKNIENFMSEYFRLVSASGSECCWHIHTCRTKRSMEYKESKTVPDILSKIIKRGQSKGQFRTDISVNELSDLIIIYLNGQSFDWAKRSGKYNIVETGKKCIPLFCDMLSARKCI